MRQIHSGVFQERIEFEADPTGVAIGFFPTWQELFLGLRDKRISEFPAECVVIESLGYQLTDHRIESSGANQVGDDDGIACGPYGTPSKVLLDEIRID